MARDERSQPRWLGGSSERCEHYADQLQRDLQMISIRLAKHEGSERILEKHVDQAFDALSRSGLERTSGVRRPEAQVGVGAFLLGAGFAIPDIVGMFVDQVDLARPWSLSLMAIVGVTGMLLLCHGWWRNRI